MVAVCSPEHAGMGLAGGMLAAVGSDSAFGVEGTEIEMVDEAIELAIDLIVDKVHVVFGVRASRDAALIGDDDEFKTGFGELGAGLGDAVDELDERRVAEIPIFGDGAAVNDGVITIEKDGAGHRR